MLSQWREFINGSPLRQLGHHALVAAVTSFLARGVGFAKEIIVASYFGLSADLDIYFVAFSLIGFPLAIFINAIQTVFISELSADASGKEKRTLCGLTISGTLTLLIVILPLWLLLIPYFLPILASGFSTEKQQYLQQALYWLVPYYLFNGLNLIIYGILQSSREYIKNGLIPTVTPLVILFYLFIFGTNSGWLVLVQALSIGTAIESFVLLVLIFDMGLIAIPKISDWKRVLPVFTNAIALLPATIAGASIMIIEQAIAASMGEGSNASLAYGYRLPFAMQSLVVTAIGITVLPYFSTHISRKEYAYCLHSLNKLFLILGAGGLLISLIFVNFSPEITWLLYQRGNFDSIAVERVSPIQAIYFAQIPFALLSMLSIKTLSALGKNTYVSLIVVLMGVFQCFLAYYLAQKIGVVGIAWAMTIASFLVSLCSFITAKIILKRNLK